MKINIVYPQRNRNGLQRPDIIGIVRWPFMFAAYICPIINIFTGGQAWSLIVLWSLWIVWSLAISTSLVEYNRISQPIKLITEGCILLILIDVLLSPGWAITVVPNVCFAGLIVTGILFFTDLERQRQNMLPMLLLCVLSLLAAIVGLILWKGESRWSLAVMGALAFALLAACFLVLGNEFIGELKKRFHTE